MQARDLAILARLRIGPATEAGVIVAVPREIGMDDDAHAKAVRNGLIRLRLKHRVRAVEHGWALA